MALDRRRQVIDVMERVLGTAHDDERSSRVAIVELDIKPGVIATTTSVVQSTVLGRDRDHAD
jgi:hypothetical protein